MDNYETILYILIGLLTGGSVGGGIFAGVKSNRQKKQIEITQEELNHQIEKAKETEHRMTKVETELKAFKETNNGRLKQMDHKLDKLLDIHLQKGKQ